MFESLSLLQPDPILGLMTLYAQDPNPQKVDLGVGVYKTEEGLTPVLQAIKLAEAALIAEQNTKVYVGPGGNEAFLQSMRQMVFGSNLATISERLAWAQTPGGCGALRVAAEVIKKARPTACIWVSDPTWGNHIPLLGNAGLEIKTYPYYDATTQSISEAAMFECLSQVPAGDLVLVHGCCHNPTGVDLTQQQWRTVGALAVQQGFIPFVDMAYQGFGYGLEEDVRGLQSLLSNVPELVLALSCSKNFGLYRERVGAIAVLAVNAPTAQAINSHMMAIVRGIYSMPPDHGAALVAAVWQNTHWQNIWRDELNEMRQRIAQLRQDFVAGMNERGADGRFDFILSQFGMFSFLGLNAKQVQELMTRYSIYLLGNSRASIAGLNRANLNYVCDAIIKVV
ncbi:MAG TPA: amino acid aminotransferase [Cellvibrionaceae bacterium]